MDKPFDPEVWLSAAAPTLNLPIEDEWRPGIRLYLSLIAQASTLFMDWPLDPQADEPANVFRP